ncbi:MAG: helix-turn-helix domain-containing protein [Nonlabens sp.]|uniref:helix-turn-helix domain-containing protein n=1 Tax=Nonlabens sp. TaxID=1888209 RepID=UPI003EF6E3E1
MNQPDLGNYISNLRKEQGLTQEELVEKCNINVRTIQRIEAGEVTPRSYTVKNILEALGTSFDEVFKVDQEKKKVSHRLEKSKTFLIYAMIAGIIYFIASTFEVIADTTYSADGGKIFTNPIYISFKLTSLIASSIFMYGVFMIGKAYDSAMIKITALCFIIVCLIIGTVDGFIYVHEFHSHMGYHISRIVIFGLLYSFLGAGFFLKRNELGNLGKWAGITGLIGGICLVTIILVVPGVISYAAFEILLIILFYQQWSQINAREH